MEERYDKIYLPFTDVYQLAGSDVFNNLQSPERGRNLVVLPYEFVTTMGKMKEGGGGSSDALNMLKSEIVKLDNKVESKESISTYRVSDNLDVAIIETPGETGDKFSVKNIEKIIDDEWEPTNGNRPNLITTDDELHIKFTNRGSIVSEPEFLVVNEDIVNEGIIEGNDDLLCALYENKGVLSLDDAMVLADRELRMNQFVRFRSSSGQKMAHVTGDLKRNTDSRSNEGMISRITGVDNVHLKLFGEEEYSKQMQFGKQKVDNILGIKPLDMEQYAALQYCLMEPSTDLVFIAGSQGSGKTLLAYVAAIEQILWHDKETKQKRKMPTDKRSNYASVCLIKPTDIMGGSYREVGFLPGSLYDKLEPHLAPYKDAHKESLLGEALPFEEMFMHPRYATKDWDKRSPEYNGMNIAGSGKLPGSDAAINFMFTGFSRGRNLKNQFVIIDEAQNLTPYELKTLVGRLSPGSKYVILGDPKQLDNPHCSRGFNGFTYTINHYINRPYTSLVKLSRNYRHQISEDSDSMNVFAR